MGEAVAVTVRNFTKEVKPTCDKSKNVSDAQILGLWQLYPARYLTMNKDCRKHACYQYNLYLARFKILWKNVKSLRKR
jgi:hypothetical protein